MKKNGVTLHLLRRESLYICCRGNHFAACTKPVLGAAALQIGDGLAEIFSRKPRIPSSLTIALELERKRAAVCMTRDHQRQAQLTRGLQLASAKAMDERWRAVDFIHVRVVRLTNILRVHELQAGLR